MRFLARFLYVYLWPGLESTVNNSKKQKGESVETVIALKSTYGSRVIFNNGASMIYSANYKQVLIAINCNILRYSE